MGEFKKDKYIFSTMSVIAERGNEIEELREKEISLITKELFLYKVLLRDLVNHFPTYKERNLILNIAYYIVEEDDIFQRFERLRHLPFDRLSKATKTPKVFLELWQDYIIAYVLIISNPNYIYLQKYLKVEMNDRDKEVLVDMKRGKDVSHRGIAFKVNKKSVIILTSSGEFIKIKKSEDSRVGKEVHGFEKMGVVHYKFHIALGILFIFLICFSAYKSYNTVNSTIVFTCTSQVKMEVNKKNKVIYSYSATDKGTEMIDAVSPMDRDIDECLTDFMRYAKENNMVPQGGFVVIITGQALKYDELEKTDEYIVDNNVAAQINNAGSLHNVYESVQNKRNASN